MNKKGFTLVELLATIAIMGLITIMITPSIIKLQNSNKQKKFEVYEKVLVEAAKLYVQKEGEDINKFGISDWIGCVEISYQDLFKNDFIKSFDDTDYDCSSSKVRVYRNTRGETYNYNLICNSKNPKKKDYSSINIEDGECSVSVSE